MTKRARRDGESVYVEWPPGEPYAVEFKEVVERGHQLSADAPAGLRDELLKTEGWSEVQDSSGTSSPSKSDDKKES